MMSTQAMQYRYLVYPLELVNQAQPRPHLQPNSRSAEFVIKGLIYLEACACFSVHMWHSKLGECRTLWGERERVVGCISVS